MTGEFVDEAAAMEAVEAELEDLDGRIAVCGQAMLLSRVAIAGGLATFALCFTSATAFQTAPVLLLAFTAVIGGLVWLGSNKATREELGAQRAEVEARQSRLFDHVAARNGWRDITQTRH